MPFILQVLNPVKVQTIQCQDKQKAVAMRTVRDIPLCTDAHKSNKTFIDQNIKKH